MVNANHGISESTPLVNGSECDIFGLATGFETKMSFRGWDVYQNLYA